MTDHESHLSACPAERCQHPHDHFHGTSRFASRHESACLGPDCKCAQYGCPPPPLSRQSDTGREQVLIHCPHGFLSNDANPCIACAAEARIVAWLRAEWPVPGGIADIADAIEKGEHR